MNPSSSSSSSSLSSTLISASSFLSSAPSTSTTDLYDKQEIRMIVLDYLKHRGFVHSVKAFVEELQHGHQQDDEDHPPHRDEIRSGLGQNGNDRKGNKLEMEMIRMQGIEKTPEPSSRIDHELDLDEEMIERSQEEEEDDRIQVERELIGTSSTNRQRTRTGDPSLNSKAVAFELQPRQEEEEEDEAFEGNDWLSKEEWEQIKIRRDIRDAILSGKIHQATELIDQHFPNLLSDSTTTTTTTSKPSSSCSPHTFFVTTPSATSAPLPRSTTTTTPAATSLGVPISRPGTPKPTYPILGATFGSWSLSLEPQILALNLQLQSFVELMRSAHSSSSTPSTPTTNHGHLGDSFNSENGGHHLSLSTASLTSSTSALNIAISSSQALNLAVQRLPNGKDRDRWEQECIDVSGLMAYKDLWNCPVRGYLAQERRETLAELINAAILARTGQTPLPIVALIARSTTAVWSALAELKHPFTPAMNAQSSANNTSSTIKENKGKQPKVYAKFDLKTFLSERDVDS